MTRKKACIENVAYMMAIYIVGINDPIYSYRSFLDSDNFFPSASLNNWLSSITERTMYTIRTRLATHMAVIAA